MVPRHVLRPVPQRVVPLLVLLLAVRGALLLRNLCCCWCACHKRLHHPHRHRGQLEGLPAQLWLPDLPHGRVVLHLDRHCRHLLHLPQALPQPVQEQGTSQLPGRQVGCRAICCERRCDCRPDGCVQGGCRRCCSLSRAALTGEPSSQ